MLLLAIAHAAFAAALAASAPLVTVAAAPDCTPATHAITSHLSEALPRSEERARQAELDCAAAGARDWTAKTEDNICGLRDLAQVSNPVVIDFQACLDATPEMKKIKAEKIDPKSPDGIRLTTEATNRVTQACESVQKANGYCSVWKSIKHKDGRAITDVSSQVTALF